MTVKIPITNPVYDSGLSYRFLFGDDLRFGRVHHQPFDEIMRDKFTTVLSVAVKISFALKFNNRITPKVARFFSTLTSYAICDLPNETFSSDGNVYFTAMRVI